MTLLFSRQLKWTRLHLATRGTIILTPGVKRSEENDTFSSYVALDDVTNFEAAELDAIALLGDTRNDDLDPEASRSWCKRVHKRTFLSERTKKRVQAKQKERARADILFDRHICRWRTVDLSLWTGCDERGEGMW